MKAIITLLVLGGLVLGGIYMFGGYKEFDPEKQGAEAKAKIKPGMSLQEVVKVAGKNPRYQPINKFEQKVGKQVVHDLRPGPMVDFDLSRVEQRIRDKQVPNGFILTYRYSERTAIAVQFDAAGKVTEMTDAPTMADLLQTR